MPLQASRQSLQVKKADRESHKAVSLEQFCRRIHVTLGTGAASFRVGRMCHKGQTCDPREVALKKDVKRLRHLQWSIRISRFDEPDMGASHNGYCYIRANRFSELLHIKDNLAAFFRDEIIGGRLSPGEKIVEVQWAKKLGISQTSVREALNILTAEGFVQKGSGRTAQVTQLTDEDVIHSYELRAVLEGYAARIVAAIKSDLAPLEQALEDMRSAVQCNNMRAFYERDLHFHVLMAEMTGNKMLVQAVKRIIQHFLLSW